MSRSSHRGWSMKKAFLKDFVILKGVFLCKRLLMIVVFNINEEQYVLAKLDEMG